MEQSTEMRVVLMMPEGFAAFKAYLSKEFAVENILFWHEARIFREYALSATADRTLVLTMAKAVFDHYFREGSVLQINVAFTTMTNVTQNLQAATDDPKLPLTTAADIFQEAAKHIFGLMIHDSYPRFTRSTDYASIAESINRAKLEYAMHAAEHPNDHPGDFPELTPNASAAGDLNVLVAHGSSDALAMNEM